MQKYRKGKSELIEHIFSYRKINQLNQYLQQNPQIPLLDLINSQGNTVLHQLAYQGHLDLIKLFAKHARKQLQSETVNKNNQLYKRDSSQQLARWMSIQNKQGFTPLLYAAYNGHMNIIKYLIETHRVSQTVTTNNGLNVLHLAAQKNMLMPFLYFKKKIDVNSTDKDGTSSLHWAAYMNSQQVVGYLLSLPQLETLNAQDVQGNTPLMLAVNYGNTRIVRKLLIKGANRYIQSNDGKTPLAVARQNQYKTITKMLNQEYTCWDLCKFYCNVKVLYKPKNRKWTFPIIFLVSFISVVGALNFFIQFVQDWLLYIQAFVMGITMLIYLSLLKGPSISQRKDCEQIMAKSNQKTIRKICFQCMNDFPKRSHHCDICHVCVKQYDHHCTWINNCVGKRNLARFIIFLFLLILCLAIVGLLSFLEGFSLLIEKEDIYNYKQYYQKIMIVGVLAICFLSSLFIFPVVTLFAVQIKNLLKNRTTFETIRGPAQQNNNFRDIIKKYNNNMSFRNCRTMCAERSSFLSSQEVDKSQIQNLQQKLLE